MLNACQIIRNDLIFVVALLHRQHFSAVQGRVQTFDMYNF